MFRRTAVASIFLILCVRAVQAQTVLDGVYSNAQAERGQAFYKTYCGNCHGSALEGVSAPSLMGNRFIERWREGALHPLYEFIRQRMPFGRPATAKPIPDNEYLDILTYVLKVNGYRSGDRELTPGLLPNVMLVGMNGPQPVPDGSHVITVGCLSQAGEGLWVLFNATEPARTSTEDTSNAVDLKISSEKKLGTLTFRLADLEAVPDFKPAAHNGHRMQVKGFLTRQPNAERISLSAMDMIDSRCGG